ncbi:MAG: anthranilate synthase component 1 [Deltaproteobacteria bacterium]|nr:anthranilate synthase component 1 [Deltaproteobacteria bacterium]
MSPRSLAAGETLALSRTYAHCPDPVTLFSELAEGGRWPNTLLLESAETSTQAGEKSLLVVRSALRARCTGREVEITSLNANGRSLLPWIARSLGRDVLVKDDGSTFVVRYEAPVAGDEEARLHAPSPMDVLRGMVLSLRPRASERTLLPLAAGVFSYDLLGQYETLPPPAADPLGWPEFELCLADQVVWLNHRQGSATVVLQVFGGEHAEGVYHDATSAMVRLGEALQRSAGAVGGAGAVDEGQDSRGKTPSVPTVDLDDAGYGTLVQTLKQHIVAGDVFQIVPSRTFSLPCRDALAAYRVLRRLNPSPYMFFVHGTRGVLFGASPETALKVEGRPPRVEIRPIAGTRPRGKSADGRIDRDLDSRLEADLRLDEKELAEHLMLVDLARNDVARVSVPGTRAVSRLLGVDRYSHVMHLVSHVEGELRPELDALHAYAATMNMGTLVGAPKLKAAELLRLHEATARGPYGGAVGYLAQDGAFDTAIVIRSAVVQHGLGHVRAGAGVVYDSEPAAEAAETRRKAEAVLEALRQTHDGSEP